MTRHASVDFIIWILKANVILWVINGLLLLALLASGSGFNYIVDSNLFSKITLFETGVIFIVGGAIAFSGSASSSKIKEHFLKSREQWTMEKLRTHEKKANRYLLLAAVIFVESLLISILGF